MAVDVADGDVIAALARDTVRAVAPQEMPLFRANSEAYFENPEKSLRPKKSGDELLGFGVGVEVTLLTPIILEVSREVFAYLAKQVAAALKEESKPIVGEMVKKLLKRFRPADAAGAPPPLTRDQLARVREIAYQAASRLGVAPDQASLIADTTVGGLAVAA